MSRKLIRVETSGAPGAASAARERAVAAAVGAALEFLGRPPDEVAVMIGPAEGAGADTEAFHYLCLKTLLRAPLKADSAALAAAGEELSRLREFERSLAAVSLEPSSRGVTGYLHRFRQALQREFDFPEALSCLWDGLRPGALSPGSRAAFLRAALPALGLDGHPSP